MQNRPVEKSKDQTENLTKILLQNPQVVTEILQRAMTAAS